MLGLLLKVQQNHAAQMDDARSTALGSETAEVSGLSLWLADAAPLVASLRSSFDDVGEAAKASDYVATSAACHTGLDLIGALVAELPSPDIRFNDGLRLALDDYEQALRHCVAGSENSDPAELAMAADQVTVGDRRWRAAVGTIGYPWPGVSSGDSGPSHVFKT